MPAPNRVHEARVHTSGTRSRPSEPARPHPTLINSLINPPKPTPNLHLQSVIRPRLKVENDAVILDHLATTLEEASTTHGQIQRCYGENIHSRAFETEISGVGTECWIQILGYFTEAKKA